MRSRKLFCIFISVCVLNVIAGQSVAFDLPAASLDAPTTPAWTDSQIEADWLRQDQLRMVDVVVPPNQTAAPAQKCTLEEDAAGAVDGVINGGWGFHTENEENPWWRIDLVSVRKIDRLVIYNRCDGGMGARNNRIVVWTSTDGATFDQAYQHDGTAFLGFTDKKPLVVELAGREARYIKLGLLSKNYFHLDEVEIYADGGEKNIGPGCPCTQSSLSQWSSTSPQARVQAVPVVAASDLPHDYPTALVVKRGLQLLDQLELLGADITQSRQTLESVVERLGQLGRDASPEDQQKLYLEARWTVRRAALSNPKLDFDQIVFVKRQPGMFPHVSDQYYSWWSRPGGGICLLSGLKSGKPTVRCLTEDWPAGNFLRPEISYDGRRILFAYCRHYPYLRDVQNKTIKDALPEDGFYHIYEMDLQTGQTRQLTHGRYEDFDGRYLPGGDIVFLSTRKGTALQAGLDSARSTCGQTCPDSYVRCGGGNHRPVAVFTLHRMNGDGTNLCAISAFENFEWTPAVAWDGRIIYARWDYIDRFNGHFMSLWSTNPDGTNAQLLYGNYTKKPQCIFEARPIPDSKKLIFTATAHHSDTGGSLVLLDRTYGTEFDRPIRRLTPEVCFPEAEGWPEHYYAGPWPLSETFYLTGWADRKLPAHRLMAANDPNNPGNAMGIYLFDTFGNLTLLHRDPEISSMNPIPVRPRSVPAGVADLVEWQGPQEGSFMVQDVYRGLSGVQRGAVRRLRIVGVVPKVQPQMNSPALSISREDTGKFVLGTVPVEADGSAYFRVPSGIPYFFQALDEQGRALQTMRSLTYVQPGRTLGCVGCHEPRDTTVIDGPMPEALARDASLVTLEPSGAWPLRFDGLVQPVLDRHCVVCHSPDAKDAKAAKFDLTAARAYDNLMKWGDNDLHNLVFERDASAVGDGPAIKSRLMKMLSDPKGHEGVKLDRESLYRLTVWMDTYAHSIGAFSAEQEAELEQLKVDMAPLIER